MTKANITQYDSTPSNNADINDINIAENCPASNINNAIRELMAHLKNVDTGSQALTALSVTGALSCGAFTSNGIDDNADATAMTISSDEDVMIGTTDESSGAKFIVGSTDDDKRAFFQGSNQYRVGLKNGSNNHVFIGSGGADNFRVSNSSGSTLFELNSSGNIVLPTSSAGIHLGVTSATPSNLLDDYEEGTFTATMTGSTSNPNSTIQDTSAYYTKIGRQVWIVVNFINVDTTGASGSVIITGLPFASLASSGDAYVSGNVAWYKRMALNSNVDQVAVEIGQGASQFSFICSSSGNAWTDAVHSAGNNFYLRASATYPTAS